MSEPKESSGVNIFADLPNGNLLVMPDFQAFRVSNNNTTSSPVKLSTGHTCKMQRSGQIIIDLGNDRAFINLGNSKVVADSDSKITQFHNESEVGILTTGKTLLESLFELKSPNTNDDNAVRIAGQTLTKLKITCERGFSKDPVPKLTVPDIRALAIEAVR